MLLVWMKCENLICMTVETFQDHFILKTKEAIPSLVTFLDILNSKKAKYTCLVVWPLVVNPDGRCSRAELYTSLFGSWTKGSCLS